MEDITLLKEQNATLTARLEKAKEVFKQMKADMTAKDEEISNLQIQIDTLNTKNEGVENHQGEISALNSQIEDLNSVLSELSESNNKLKGVCEAKDKEIAELNNAISTYSETIKRNETTINNAIEKLNSADTKIKTLENEITSKYSIIKTKNDELTNLQTNISTDKNAINEMTKKLTTVEEQLKALHIEHKKVVDENAAFQEAISKLSVERDNALENYDNLVETAKEYKKSVDDRNEKIKNAMDIITSTVNDTPPQNTNGKNLPGMYDFLAM